MASFAVVLTSQVMSLNKWNSLPPCSKAYCGSEVEAACLHWILVTHQYCDIPFAYPCSSYPLLPTPYPYSLPILPNPYPYPIPLPLPPITTPTPPYSLPILPITIPIPTPTPYLVPLHPCLTPAHPSTCPSTYHLVLTGK